MQVTILTSKEDVKRTRGLGCLIGGRPGAERPSGGMVLLEGHGELCAEIFGKDQRRRRRASLRLAEAGGQMARRVVRLLAGSRRYGAIRENGAHAVTQRGSALRQGRGAA